MTVPLSPGSSRLVHARRFGEELDRAMRTRKVGAKRLAPLTGVAVSAIGNWRAGLNLPRTDVAQRLAESLAWPKLASIARAARTQPCTRCGRPFVNDGGTPKRYCSQACRQIDAQLRRPTPGAALAGELRQLLREREGLKGGLRKEAVRDALGRYVRTESRSRQRVDVQGRVLDDHRAAVAAMCASCEPEGRCRDAGCALRPVSPLPLVRAEKTVEIATPAPGAHGTPEAHERWLAAQREANARRWSRPGEREAQGEATRSRFAAMTPEERLEHRASVSRGIDPAKRSATSKRVHAARRARAAEGAGA